MRRTVKCVAMTVMMLGLSLASSQSWANPIIVGESKPPDVFATDPLTTGTILADTGVQPFDTTLIGGVRLFGTGEAWVVQGYTENPFGGLTFVYQVSLTGGQTLTGTPLLERVTVANFDGSTPPTQTDVGYYTTPTSGQIAPMSVDRSSNNNVIGFNFIPKPSIEVGQTSVLLIVATDRPQFVPGTLTVQDGLTANMNGFSPTGVPVPEPSTIAGAGVLSLLSLGLVGYRRGRASA